MQTLLVAAFGCLVGCAPSGWTCEPGPWHSEVWSADPIVIAQLRVGCGFPDEQIDYRIVTHGQTVFDGSLEHFNYRHGVLRLEGGGVEVAIWDRACVVTATSVTCREIDYAKRWSGH